MSETDELFELGMQSLVQQTMELLSIRPSTNSSIPYRVVGSDLRIDKDYLYNLAEKYVSANYDPNKKYGEVYKITLRNFGDNVGTISLRIDEGTMEDTIEIFAPSKTAGVGILPK